MSCRAILLLRNLLWGFTGFHQSGLGFQDHVVHNFLEVATGFLADAELAVGSGAVLQDVVHVSNFFATIEFIYDVVHELEIFKDEIALGDLTFFAEVDQLAADAVTRSAPLILHHESAAVHAEALVLRMELVKLYDRRLNQCCETHRFIEAQRNVANTHLESVEEWVRPDVPPDLLR